MYILFDFRELQRLLTYIIFGNVLSSVPIPDSQNFRAKIIIVKYSKHLQKFEIFEKSMNILKRIHFVIKGLTHDNTLL